MKIFRTLENFFILYLPLLREEAIFYVSMTWFGTWVYKMSMLLMFVNMFLYVFYVFQPASQSKDVSLDTMLGS